MGKCFLCRWVNSGLQKFSSVPPGVLYLPWVPGETVCPSPVEQPLD